tara:strand:- start:85891 stop:86121 length:231 start_codon:yes stop_codon:yes gene_type:complete
MNFNIKKNWKTTISVILTTITSLYQLFADNAEFLGIDNKYIMGASIVITAITIIINGINNGEGETKIKKLLSYIKI